MSTLRRDPVVGRWVINTDELEKRTSIVEKPEVSESSPECPLCAGNEGSTPPELFAIRPDGSSPNSPGWEVRVVPNFSAAMQIGGELNRRAELMYDLMDSIGTHELVIGSPEHVSNMADLPESQFNRIFSAYRQRMLDLKTNPDLRSVFIYKSYGTESLLESLSHTHSHIVATPVTPKSIKEQYVGAKKYFQYKERCVYCDIVRQEIMQKKRIISSNAKFIAIAPFASKYSHEVWILPRTHNCDFENSPEKDFPYLSSILKEILLRIKAALNNPPYNFALFSGPNKKGREGYWKTIDQDYHWHIEIMPIPKNLEGFEWATGFYLNDTTPETAAQKLREVKVRGY
ncbi:MAG: galactose-1-phosphate uridylyltransferase [candidate division Zixibacteria bacterium]|nr:galactose-1-phosphate uridylyltransferase [candidate division Zixibacteria bacterium]